MSQVYAGKTKEALDQVDPSLIIADVAGVLGNFVKYATEKAPQQAEVVEVNVCLKSHLTYSCTCTLSHTHRKGMRLKL